MTSNNTPPSKEKRSKMELYYAVLNAIRQDMDSNNSVKATRIQFLIGTSYDKLMNYFIDLEEKKLIKTNPIIITDKGKKLLSRIDAQEVEMDAILKNLTEKEATQLSDLLDKMRSAIG